MKILKLNTFKSCYLNNFPQFRSFKRHQLKIKLLIYPFSFLILLWLAPPSFSQYKILEDKDAIEKVNMAIDSIYNLNFDAADVIIADLEENLLDYPGTLLLKAFYVKWKYRPIKIEHKSYALFESYLLKGIEKSEAMLDHDKNDVEANFFLMACHSFLAELYVDNGQNFKALGEAKDAYKYIKIGFEKMEENPEFYFSSGIYNYYREKYPEENPFYKSFLWVFRSGDMEEGLNMLEQGYFNAVFTRAECLTYLFHINLRYEDKPEESIYYSILLRDKYPNNLHYISNYVENSVRLEKYVDLLPHINRLLQSENHFYQYLGGIFYGVYIEKTSGELNEAISQLKVADNLGDVEEIRIPHYDSILFLCLGRIYRKIGNEDLANQYFKKSIKSAEYIAYRTEAEELLMK